MGRSKAFVVKAHSTSWNPDFLVEKSLMLKRSWKAEKDVKLLKDGLLWKQCVFRAIVLKYGTHFNTNNNFLITGILNDTTLHNDSNPKTVQHRSDQKSSDLLWNKGRRTRDRSVRKLPDRFVTLRAFQLRLEMVEFSFQFQKVSLGDV